MTSVSPLVLHNNKDVALKALPSEPDPGQAATSFAQVLDSKKDDTKAHAKTAAVPHAYSFAELGMFGLHATAFVSDDKDGTKARMLAPPTMGGSGHGQDRKQTAQPQSAPPLIYVPSLKVDAPETVSRPQPIVIRSASSGAPKSSALASISLGISGGESEQVPVPRSGGGIKVPVPTRPAQDPVAVTVSGPDDALRIAVRSAGDAAPEVVRVRRLVETTVAQFEMAIAELHFNGQASNPVFSIGGGMNGGSGR